MKKERDFQSALVDELRDIFEDGFVFKFTPAQGMPDILILYKNRWASLECKREATSPHRPNQDYYVDVMGKMSFSRFIFPENKEEVIYELCEALGLDR